MRLGKACANCIGFELVSCYNWDMEKGDKYAKLRGFTIIEVSLVIAIAGLIFLMVFVALPALQRQSRDTRRRESVMSLISSVKKFQSNNRGALPSQDSSNSDTAWYDPSVPKDGTGWKNFYAAYLGDSFVDPDGENYALRIEDCGVNKPDTECSAESLKNGSNNVYDTSFPFTVGGHKYTMLIVKQATCQGDRAVATANPRKIAVLYRLEGAGTYCNNS